jgi:hypothetical protein
MSCDRFYLLFLHSAIKVAILHVLLIVVFAFFAALTLIIGSGTLPWFHRLAFIFAPIE